MKVKCKFPEQAVADPISRDVVLGCTDMGHSDLRQVHDEGHLGPIANFFLKARKDAISRQLVLALKVSSPPCPIS